MMGVGCLMSEFCDTSGRAFRVLCTVEKYVAISKMQHFNGLRICELPRVSFGILEQNSKGDSYRPLSGDSNRSNELYRNCI